MSIRQTLCAHAGCRAARFRFRTPEGAKPIVTFRLLSVLMAIQIDDEHASEADIAARLDLIHA